MAKPIGLVGAGGWGIALAKLLSDKAQPTTLWCRSAETYRELEEKRAHSTYLPNIALPAGVEVTRSLETAVAGKSLIICAVPSHAAREVMSSAAAHVNQETIVLCGTKGLEEESLKTMSEVLADIFGVRRSERHAFLSGPTFAVEIARGLPAAVTVAAYRDDVVETVQETLGTQSLRVYSSKDVIGVQMGGVIKNVIAIAAGISDGLGLGLNARAALITRGLAELTRLGLALGGRTETFMGLAGAGDLILTCTGDLSRNRRVGLLLARGESLDAILKQLGHVAEGVLSAPSIEALAADKRIDMPITRAVCAVLFRGTPPRDAVQELLARDPREEA